jgi:hypothetical protein
MSPTQRLASSFRLPTSVNGDLASPSSLTCDLVNNSAIAIPNAQESAPPLIDSQVNSLTVIRIMKNYSVGPAVSRINAHINSKSIFAISDL